VGHRRLLCWSLGIAVLLVASAAAAQTRAPSQKPEPSRPPLIIKIPKPAGGARTPAPKPKQPRQTPPARPGATSPPPFVLPGPITLPQLTPIPFPQIPPPAPQATPAPMPRLPPIVIRVPRAR
jgi:fused signal recognition particle receptor